MNGKQIIILISGLAVSVLIVWHDLPIVFPWLINILMLFAKLSAVWVLTAIAYVIAGGKKKPI